MDFGLGLVLTFTDNATSGINNAVNTLNQLTQSAESASNQLNQIASLSAFSTVANTVGSGMMSAGSAIISTFGQIIGKVNETGQTLMFAENQLGKLYEGSSRTGKDVLNDISQYAKKSIFEFEDLIPVVTMLKANGIEAFDMISSSTGKANQTLMDYAADLAAFNPQMRNAYGTGIKAAMGALNEYIAEGNAMSLKRGASLDITSLLGEEKGATIEERSRQVADLLEKLNMVGMTAQLAESPMTKLSNMQDTLFQFTGMVSQSGVYDSFNRIISIFADFINNIPEDRLQSIAKTVGSALSTIMKPLEWVAEKVVALGDAFAQLVENNPKIAKFVTVGFAVAGVLLLLGGVTLKVLGSLGYLTLMISQLGYSFSAIGGLMKAGSAKIIGSLLPMTFKLGLLYLAWKTDLFGIRTLVTSFVEGTVSAFSTANKAVSGSIGDLQTALSNLHPEDSFFDGLTLGFMKLIVLTRALHESWNGFNLSEDTFMKAKELGILPLIESILDLKFRFDNFKEGFIKGWNEVSTAVKNAVMGMFNFFNKGGIFSSAFDGAEKFFSALSNNDVATWQSFGTTLGRIAPAILSFTVAMKALHRISSIFGRERGRGLIPPIFGGRGSRGGSNERPSGATGGLLSNPKRVLKDFASISIIVGGVATLAIALGALYSIPNFAWFTSQGVTMLGTLIPALLPIVALSGALGLVSKAMEVLRVNPKNCALGIANIAILLGGMQVLVTAMGALNSIPGFSDFLSNGAVVMTTLARVFDTMFSVSVLGSFAAIALMGAVPVTAVLLGIANLALILGGITALVVAFGALSKIEGFNDFIASGGDTLALLFNQLGKIAGSIIGGFSEGVTNSLPEIGNNLSEFGENMKPFFEAVKGAPLNEIGDFAVSIGKFFALMGANEILSFFTGGVNLTEIATQLANFGTTAAPFFNSVGSYSDAGLEKAPKVFEAISGIGNYSFKTGGLAQLFTGETNLTTIGTQLAGFAPNGLTFFSSVANYSEAGLEKAPKVFQALSGIGDYDFKTGGLFQLFTGSTDLGSIGEQLADFCENGKTFFNSVADYSLVGINKAPKVFEAIAGIGDYDFKTGGLAQLFTGSTNLGDVGAELTSFGTEAKGFFDSISSLSAETIANGKAVLDALGTISSFKSGGLVDLFTGGFDLESVGTQLSNFGNNVKGFFTVAGDVSATALYNGKRIFEVVGGADSYMFKSGGLSQLFTGSVDIAGVGTQLSSFATNAKTFFTTAESISTGGFENAPKMFSSLAGIDSTVDVAVKSNGKLSSFGAELVSFADNVLTFLSKSEGINNTTGIAGLSTALETFATIFTNTKDSISTGATTISTSLTNVSTAFSDTRVKVDSDTKLFSSSISTMVNEVTTNLRTLESTFNSIRLQIPQTHISVPHFSMSGAFNPNTKSVPHVNVSWYQQGGVFNKPSVIGVGENGSEAVVPLEKNLGWITSLAHQIGDELSNVVHSTRMMPVGVEQNSNPPTLNQGETQYMTTNNSTNEQKEVHYDDSITFAEGAIQVHVQNASEDEAIKLARKVMEYIKRQKQIDRISSYAT